MNISAIVLAAGKGKRMNSDTAKVLHTLAGRPMVEYTLEKLKKLDLEDIIIVIGHLEELVRKSLGDKWHYVRQSEALGTGNAVKAALPALPKDSKYVLVLNGDDSAFYKVSTLKKFIKHHIKSKAPISMIAINKPEAKIARVIRDKNGFLKRVVEWRDYENSKEKSEEINCGTYIFEVEFLKENIGNIPLSNTGEYYITEVLRMARKNHRRVSIFQLEDPGEWVGVNTPEELEKANQLMKGDVTLR